MQAQDHAGRKQSEARRAVEPAGRSRTVASAWPYPQNLSPDTVAVLQRTVGNEAVTRLLTERAQEGSDVPPLEGAGLLQAAGSGDVTRGAQVQRALTVADDDLTQQYKRETVRLPPNLQRQYLDRMVAGVVKQFTTVAAPNFSKEDRAAFFGERDRIRGQLEKAIVSPVGEKGLHPVLGKEVGKHPDFGAKNHDIRVANYTDLARNLMGWVYSKDKRREEKRAAEQIQQDVDVDKLMDVLLRRIYRRVRDIEKGDLKVRGERLSSEQFSVMRRELMTGMSELKSQPKTTNRFGIKRHDPAEADKPIGLYLDHFAIKGTRPRSRLIEKGGFWELLQNPETFSFRDKVIALHDLSDYFGHSRHVPPTMGKELLPKIGEREKRSTAGYRADGSRIAVQDRGQAGHPSTRNENSPTTKLARSRNVPVWAGQSYTAARMFLMAEEFGATREEIAAVGWGIFSFWRLNFDHTTDFAYHTLHEVMDIAQNFGVPYHIDDQYGSLPMVEVNKIMDKLLAVEKSTEAVYQDASDEVKELERSPRLDDRSRTVRKAEREFLETAKEVRRELREIRQKIRDRVDSLNSWVDLTARERTRLLKYCLDDLEDVQRRVRRRDEKLADLEQAR